MGPFNKMKSHAGFSLIELLVAISIISILSALLTANFIGARQRARDGQRKSDVRQIQSALEFIRADTGRYLTNAQYDTATGSSCGPTQAFTVGTVVYMQSVPCDPVSTSTRYLYDDLASGGTIYRLTACLENAADSQKDSVAVAPCSVSFSVRNP